MRSTARKPSTVARLRSWGAWLLLVIGTSFLATVAHAGQGVWTSGGPNGNVTVLAIDPKTPSTLYAGNDTGGVFKSTDSGGTWGLAGISDLTTDWSYSPISTLAIDPSTPSTLYAGAFADYLVGGGGNVYKSTDGGASWAGTGLASLSVWALAIDPSTPSTLYAGGGLSPGGRDGRVFKSTNAGATWATANTGLDTSRAVSSLAIDPSRPSTLYAGTYGGGCFKSTDSGGTWAAVAGLTNTCTWVAINPANPNTLYAGQDGGVLKSTDSGGTWSPVNGLSSFGGISSLAFDPSSPYTLYAGTPHGAVFRSTDGGGTWSAVYAGLPDLSVVTLALDPTGTTLYATLSDSKGLWQLTLPTGGGGGVFLIPAGTHVSAANGAFYTSNVSLSNTGSAPASFAMKFLGHDQDGASGPEQTFNLEAGKSVTYFDVLGTVFGQTSNYGAIRITSDTSMLKIVSVTSATGFGGTMSQTVPAVRSSDLIPAGSSRSILYVREGDGFRSNLVLASNAAVPTNVDVSLISPEAATLATKSYTVPPNGMTQVRRVVRDMGFTVPVTGARLVLSSSTPGAAYAAFISVIDEVTNDLTTIEAR